MLKPSRTWPSILQKTMAVVQLRFDGKYAYSTIADINKPHVIENQVSITRRVEGAERVVEEVEDFHDNKPEAECICEHKKDLLERCRSAAYNGNGRQQNGHLGRSSMNGICNFHSGSNHHHGNNDKNRRRSESIKVENWDFIYRERAFLDVSPADRNAVPK
jgi:hypothetical protein